MIPNKPIIFNWADHVTCIGESSDRRTNRWLIKCPICARKIKPSTTRLRFQNVDCEKCDAVIVLDYNEETIKVR